jgi:predicted enzyme related to lactoylglutathione lyase
MFQKVAFTMYPVKDMPRARAFYENVLGLGQGSGGASSPWVEFDLPGGGCLAITTVTPNEPSASAGGTIAFEVDHLPATIAELKSRDVKFLAEGIESPVCRMAIISDPDGNAIVLHKLKTAEERQG